MVTEIERKVHDYNEKIQRGEYPEPGEYCRRCRQKLDEFKLHDQRQRKLRIVVEALVQIVTTWLVRWKCPICKQTFTAYPDFIVAHKRYAIDHVVNLSECYMGQEVRYEDALRDGNAHIGYPQASRFVNMKQTGNEEDESFLASSTLWRWCGWLGSFEEAVSRALDMIRQKTPNTPIFRLFRPVYPSKYRSEKRKKILETAMRVLQMREQEIGEGKFFPRFAIGR